MEKMWSYGGRDYPFDISESACADRMQAALCILREEYAAADTAAADTDAADTAEPMEAAAPEESAAGTIREQCGMIGRFFAGIFGEEAVGSICGGGMSLEAYTAAYVDFILFVNEQLEALAAFRRSIEEKIAARIGSLAETGEVQG